jgi:hypothetical protein
VRALASFQGLYITPAPFSITNTNNFGSYSTGKFTQEFGLIPRIGFVPFGGLVSVNVG